MLSNKGELYVIEFGLRPGGGPIFHSVMKHLYGASYPKLYIDSITNKPIDGEFSTRIAKSLTLHFYSTKKEKNLLKNDKKTTFLNKIFKTKNPKK